MEINFGLREKKMAQTKVSIILATIEYLRNNGNLEALSIKDIASNVNISEATFYNYFPAKKDLIFSLLRFWSLDSFRSLEENHKELEGLPYIKMFINQIKTHELWNFDLFSEFIANIALHDEDICRSAITDVEVYTLFPDHYEVLSPLKGYDIPEYIAKHFDIAKKKNEISSKVNPLMTAFGLFGVILGTTISYKRAKKFNVSRDVLWDFQIETFFKGL